MWIVSTVIAENLQKHCLTGFGKNYTLISNETRILNMILWLSVAMFGGEMSWLTVTCADRCTFLIKR